MNKCLNRCNSNVNRPSSCHAPNKKNRLIDLCYCMNKLVHLSIWTSSGSIVRNGSSICIEGKMGSRALLCIYGSTLLMWKPLYVRQLVIYSKPWTTIFFTFIHVFFSCMIFVSSMCIIFLRSY